jgi:CubicO group peptidase (beta-lactamase class C family)
MKQFFYTIICINLITWTACDISNVKDKTNQSVIDSIDSLLLSEYQNNRFDGTITIGSQDEILYQKAFGTANRSWDIPMSLDTRFDIASLNKSFIATLILIAEEDGKLSTKDHLNTFFPKGSFDSNITLHQMMCHISGLPDYNDIPSDLQKRNYSKFKRLHFSNDAYATYISHLKSKHSPGEHFYYSNFAYHLLAIILEKVYQKPFSTILQENICQPLGLKNTFSEISNEAIHTKVATGYSFDKDENAFYKNNFIDFTLGRRIFSTSEDLYKWAIALQKSTLLNDSSTQKIFTNHLASIEKDISYGYGWVINKGEKAYKMGNLDIKQTYFVHGGSTEGYKAMLSNINDSEYVIAHLSNIGNQTNEFELTKKIVPLLIHKK